MQTGFIGSNRKIFIAIALRELVTYLILLLLKILKRLDADFQEKMLRINSHFELEMLICGGPFKHH